MRKVSENLSRVRAQALLIGCAAAMILAGRTVVADERGQGFLAKALELRVDEALQKVGTLGARVFNDGDAAGSCRLLEGALRTVHTLLDHRPGVQTSIARGLKAAQREPRPEERAFILRDVLDRTREALRPTTKAAVPSATTEDMDGLQNRPTSPRAKAAVPSPTTPSGFSISARERALLEATNKERANKGLEPLRPNARLFRAARLHSANMARQNKMAHELDDKKPDERIRDAGYQGATWGENIAAGMPTAADVMEVWMNSEGHRANILNPDYTEIGIGVATDEQGVPFYTEVFATPLRQ